jgi:uncharacterized protein (DUF697 family)
MASRNTKVHGIIHSAATSAAAVGGGMAQIPGSDAVVIVPLQIAMIISIAGLHGHKLTQSAAEALVATFAAETGGRFVSQWAVGWIPFYGNAINATTAFTITEVVGWAADAYFSKHDED